MSKVKLTLGLILVVAVSLSAATVVKARHDYYGVCSQLDGFPGLLQKAGFFVSGTCATQIGGSLCQKGAACTVNGNAGTCANTGGIGGSIVCTCVPNVSK
jgi:predicted secreted Zn-dependent protease